MSLRLYAFWKSSASWRVRIGLHLKQQPFELVPVNLAAGADQHTAEHAASNPMRQVPVLEVSPGCYLSQSMAILAWLDKTFPEPRLFPEDPLWLARALQLAETVNSGIQPFQNRSTVLRLEAHGIPSAPWVTEAIVAGLQGLEGAARETAGEWLVGDALSIAEVFLIPQLFSARGYGVDLSPYPTLLRIEEKCAVLPAFIAARPEVQPDAL